MNKKIVNRKSVLRYLYDQLTGNFAGFLIGMSATGLVSQFFEKRGIKNLWGLTAKKTVVDKETFSQIEWIISIVIGFVVFEVVTKLLKEHLHKNMPRYKRTIFRGIVARQWHVRFRNLVSQINARRVVFFAGMQNSIRSRIKE